MIRSRPLQQSESGKLISVAAAPASSFRKPCGIRHIDRKRHEPTENLYLLCRSGSERIRSASLLITDASLNGVD